ncbi:hypothetical protein Lepto7376_4353 [[Leptolyngbya] sp. PCC 7376]|nr:hypothetical protein Lepto7376_4353 [[Leptolyngbya] sp. PCC 7376]
MRNRIVPRMVELAEGVYIETAIPRENHAALRSGFAGYPNNPRWTVRKYKAWKQGKLWRKSLSDGSMTIHDQQLIATETALNAAIASPESERTSWRSPFKKFAFSLN